MIEPLAIDHIVLRTTRLQQMIRFYCDVIGCKVERQTDAEIGLTQLRAGSALIDLVTVDSRLGRMGGGPPAKTENNLDHFCLQIAAIEQDALLAHLSAADIKAGSFETRNGAEGFGPSIYIHDPDGNQLELRSRLSQS